MVKESRHNKSSHTHTHTLVLLLLRRLRCQNPTKDPAKPKAKDTAMARNRGRGIAASEELWFAGEEEGGGGRGWTTTETFMPFWHCPFPPMKKYLFAFVRGIKSFPLVQFPNDPSVVQLSYPVWFTSNTLYWFFWYLNAVHTNNKIYIHSFIYGNHFRNLV